MKIRGVCSLTRGDVLVREVLFPRTYRKLEQPTSGCLESTFSKATSTRKTFRRVIAEARDAILATPLLATLTG